MGRIRAGFVKRQAEKLMKINLDKFSQSFEDNKKLVSQFAEVPTKKLRNLLAGFITKNLKSNRE